ncbi:MAG: DUF1330 domain-containing protein [Myxococcales bacterium]|jgi:uncharacterized protein (DUF1330 family)|nr:MAG: DUF1330 domain-containing protein [Myxococcales bacterium]
MADDSTRSSAEEEINQEAFAAFAAKGGQGPIVMLNLLKFKPDGGLESYMTYGEAVAPLLEKVGGKINYRGAADELMIGAEDWDLIALVEYPTRQAFIDMVTSDAYQAIMHYREEALVRSVLYASNPLG